MCWVETSSLLQDSCCSMRNFPDQRERSWGRFLQRLVLERGKQTNHTLSPMDSRSTGTDVSIVWSTFSPGIYLQSLSGIDTNKRWHQRHTGSKDGLHQKGAFFLRRPLSFPFCNSKLSPSLRHSWCFKWKYLSYFSLNFFFKNNCLKFSLGFFPLIPTVSPYLCFGIPSEF